MRQSTEAARADYREVTQSLQLFNGRDLSNFYTYLRDIGVNRDPSGVFTIANGVLRISGQDWGDRVHAARDSGLLVHSVGEDGGYKNSWKHSIEVQMIEGGTGDFIVVGDGAEDYWLTGNVVAEKQGRGYIDDPQGRPAVIHGGIIFWQGRSPDWGNFKRFRAAGDVESPLGEWNTLEAIVEQGHIQVFLNGVLVNESIDTRPRRGQIQIQSEGSELFVRRFELLPL